MKSFPQTTHFVNDVNFLCGVIFINEFHTDGYFKQRAIEIYRDYSWTEESNAFDVDILINEFMDNVEIQSIEGMQNAFDIWKAILNGIHLPDSDLFNYAESTKDKAHREDGMAILEMVVNMCGCLRREVETLMKDYNLQNRSHTTHFLTPPYYAMGDVGNNATQEEKAKEKPQNKQSRTFKDYMSGDDVNERLERAKQIKGNGRDAVRDILRISFPERVNNLPSYSAFDEEFKGRISKADYYTVCKELKESWKPKKRLNKLD